MARGGVVVVSGVTRGTGKSSSIYLRAADSSQFHVEQAPREDWAEPPVLPMSTPLPATRIDTLLPAPAGVVDRRQLRLRVRLWAARAL